MSENIRAAGKFIINYQEGQDFSFISASSVTTVIHLNIITFSFESASFVICVTQGNENFSPHKYSKTGSVDNFQNKSLQVEYNFGVHKSQICRLNCSSELCVIVGK